MVDESSCKSPSSSELSPRLFRGFLLNRGLDKSLLLIGEADAGLLPFFDGAGLLGELLGNLKMLTINERSLARITYTINIVT